MKIRSAAAFAAASLLAVATQVQAQAEDPMVKLARGSGCMTCHHIEPGAKGPDGLAPIGPAWKDVASKYKGNKGAEADLTKIVLAGSNPYESHWKGKVSGLAMPPNKVVLTEAEARRLVKWILALPPAKG